MYEFLQGHSTMSIQSVIIAESNDIIEEIYNTQKHQKTHPEIL